MRYAAINGDRDVLPVFHILNENVDIRQHTIRNIINMNSANNLMKSSQYLIQVEKGKLMACKQTGKSECLYVLCIGVCIRLCMRVYMCCH